MDMICGELMLEHGYGGEHYWIERVERGYRVLGMQR